MKTLVDSFASLDVTQLAGRRGISGGGVRSRNEKKARRIKYRWRGMLLKWHEASLSWRVVRAQIEGGMGILTRWEEKRKVAPLSGDEQLVLSKVAAHWVGKKTSMPVSGWNVRMSWSGSHDESFRWVWMFRGQNYFLISKKFFWLKVNWSRNFLSRTNLETRRYPLRCAKSLLIVNPRGQKKPSCSETVLLHTPPSSTKQINQSSGAVRRENDISGDIIRIAF